MALVAVRPKPLYLLPPTRCEVDAQEGSAVRRRRAAQWAPAPRSDRAKPRNERARSMHGSAAVAGIGESPYYKRGEAPYTEFQLACIAIRRAVEDAGCTLADVDGFV